MSMERRHSPERLDIMSGSDPRAVRSRSDLRRINRIIGSRNIILHALRNAIAPPRSIIELGAGDGTLMLEIAQEMAQHWPGVRLTMLDRQHVVNPHTLAGFRQIGWQAEIVTADALTWLTDPAGERFDLALSNLFIHHFSEQQLAQLLAAIARRSDAFFACEPRRAKLPLFASQLLFLIGANEVTREDSVTSVLAGFRDEELSRLWPHYLNGWQLREYSAGLFSHCLLALRQHP